MNILYISSLWKKGELMYSYNKCVCVCVCSRQAEKCVCFHHLCYCFLLKKMELLPPKNQSVLSSFCVYMCVCSARNIIFQKKNEKKNQLCVASLVE